MFSQIKEMLKCNSKRICSAAMAALFFAQSMAIPAMPAYAFSASEAFSSSSKSSASSKSSVLSEAAYSVYAVIGKTSDNTWELSDGGETYRITLKCDKQSGIPEDAEIRVHEITSQEKDYADYLSQALEVTEGNAKAARFFDIEIWSGGERVEPAGEVEVKIELKETRDEADADMQLVHFAQSGVELIEAEVQEAKVSEAEAQEVEVLKVEKTQEAEPQEAELQKAAMQEVEAQEAELQEADLSGEDLELSKIVFNTDSFSVYGVVYTVDFHWKVDGKMYEFSLPGGGFVSFHKLVEVLDIVDGTYKGNSDIENDRIADFVADVADVEFSNPELVSTNKVEKNTTVGAIKDELGLECEYSAELTEEGIAEINAQTVEAGDWALISLKAFGTEESLTVTMKTGEQFIIRVTDYNLASNIDKQTFAFVTRINSSNTSGVALTSTAMSGGKLKAATTTLQRLYDAGNTANGEPVFLCDDNASYEWTFEYEKGSSNVFYIKASNGKYLNITDGSIALSDEKKPVYIQEGTGDHKGQIRLCTDSTYTTAINQYSNDVNQGFGLWESGTTGANNEWFTLSQTFDKSVPDTITTVDNAGEGITLKLFDYDPVSRAGEKGTLDDKDNTVETTDQWGTERHHFNQSINTGKDFWLLGWGAYSNTSNPGINDFSGLENKIRAVQGIVDNNLSGGYPKLYNGSGNGQSLKYLFNGATGGSEVVEYTANHLFEKIGDKYSYDSNKHYAEFNTSTKNFAVYNGTLEQQSKNGNGNGKAVGFFPFDTFNNAKIAQHNKWLYLNPDKDAKDNDFGGRYNTAYWMNHHNGMSLQADFRLPENGTDSYGNDITFEFSGDDDLWVFIDGVLVLDIGGVHQPIDGSINFTTGYADVSAVTDANTANADKTAGTHVSIADMFTKAGKTYDPHIRHEIKVFWLERGSCDSNCKIEFNLPLLTQKTGNVRFTKTDENNANLAGAQFTLYTDEACETPLTIANVPVTATSSDNGIVYFYVIPTGTYYMKESVVPRGYESSGQAYKVTIVDEDDSTKRSKIETLDGGPITNIVNEKKKISVSLEKRWNNNGDKNPPQGAQATFKLMQRSTNTDVQVELVDQNGLLLDSTMAGEGSVVSINENSFQLKITTPDAPSGYYHDWTYDYYSRLYSKTLEQRAVISAPVDAQNFYISTANTYTYKTDYYGGGEVNLTNSSSLVSGSYTIRPEDIASGKVTLRITNKSGEDFVDGKTPKLSITGGNGVEAVTESEFSTFELPSQGDNGNWKKTFDNLPAVDNQGNPYSYYFVEVSASPSNYSHHAFGRAASSTTLPLAQGSTLTEGGDVVVTNSTQEIIPDPLDDLIDKLPDATSNKTLKPNKNPDGTDDGTYTLTLSVTIPEYHNRSKNRANVVILYDSSNSMNSATEYNEDPNGTYGTINGKDYDEIVYGGYKVRVFMNGNWVDTADNQMYIWDRQKSEHVVYTGKKYTAGDRTRMDIASAAVTALGDKLLAYNNKYGAGTIQLAFVEYASLILHGSNAANRVTDDKAVFDSWVAACSAPGGIEGATNWDLALRTAQSINFGDDDQKYYIFISDGNPTVRVSDPKSGDGKRMNVDGRTLEGIYGTGNSDTMNYNFNAAQEVAQQAVDEGTIIYNVGIFGEATKMQSLVHHGYYEATNGDDITPVFNDIIKMITTRIGYTDVVIEDGITSLTSSTLVNGQADNFTYKVTDKDGNDVTDSMLEKLGNPKATYEETNKILDVNGQDYSYKQKEVVWNLGHQDILLEGGTYSVSFIVWPSQEAYDLAADLNNGIRQFSDLNEIEASQVEKKGGVYVVKTNTHESAKGKTAKEVNGTVTPTPDEYKPIEMTKDVGPMPLTDTTVKVQKRWISSLDKTQLSDIKDRVVKLVLKKEDAAYIEGIEIKAPQPVQIPENGIWVWPEAPTIDNPEGIHHISAGLMVSESAAKKSGLNVKGYPTTQFTSGDGEPTTYYILESGRDYKFSEVGTPDYRFELKDQTFHPMVVDGVLHDVTFSADKKKVTQMTAASGNTLSLSADNELKGGIQIRKEVYDQEGELIADDKTSFTVKVTMKNADGTPYSVTAAHGGWRLNYGPNNPNKGEPYYDEGQLINYGREQSRHDISDGTFTASFYPGDYIQVANVDKGVVYTVEEINIPSGYDKFDVEYVVYSMEDHTMTPNESHQVTVKNKQSDVGFSFSKIWVAENSDLSNIGSDEMKAWTDGNSITVTIKRIAQGAKEVDSSFRLTYEIGDEEGPFQPTNADMSGIEKTKYQLTRSLSADGKATTLTMDKVLEKQDADSKNYTYYVEEISASGATLYNTYYGTLNEGSVVRTPGAQHAGDGDIIINQEYSGYELPSTGGTGTKLFYLLGLMLTGSAGMCLGVVMRKRERHQYS